MLTSPNEIFRSRSDVAPCGPVPLNQGSKTGLFLESYSYRSHNSYMAGDKPVDAVDSGHSQFAQNYIKLP
jgi:hypothetical protein